jgi:enduracididine beta-hydroxylase
VFILNNDEVTAANQLIGRLLQGFPAAAGSDFLHAVSLQSHRLPERLLAFLLDIRSKETAATFVVSGFPVDDTLIGPTPHRWGMQRDRSSTIRHTVWLELCGSVLGDLFGWATQQQGAVVHDIAPIRDDERSQVGSSSAELLWWHTEEAFHPLKCDYLGLMCLRNHDHVPTTFASIERIELLPEIREVLFKERFVIRPDDSHLTQHGDRLPPTGPASDLLLKARQRIAQMNEDPQPVALLYGNFDSPYLSIDPFYMEVSAEDAQASHAYEVLCRAIEGELQEIALSPGDIFFIDNYRAVHGRKPFTARYDGTDRWLKRINITRDLRKSRAHRAACDSRVIY